MELLLEKPIHLRTGHEYVLADVVDREDGLKIGMYIGNDGFNLLIRHYFGGWIRIAAA